MNKAFRDVLAFHQKFGCMVGDRPALPDEKTIDLRVHLIMEETGELCDAIDRVDMANVADALADLAYVVIGAAVTFGIDLPAVWDEVQKANMAKTGGGKRADGKILKPAGWTPPDVAGVIARQGNIAEVYGDVESARQERRAGL